MSLRPSADASAFAISVLPTPASPSTKSGFPRRSARKRVTASPRSATYRSRSSAAATSSTDERSGALTTFDATSAEDRMRRRHPRAPARSGPQLGSGSGALDRALDRSFRVDGDEMLAVLGRGDEIRKSGDTSARLRGRGGDRLRVALRAGKSLLRLGRAVWSGGCAGNADGGTLNAAVSLDRDGGGDPGHRESRCG